MPFVPDITDWFVANHTPPGQAPKFPSGGSFIPDSAPICEYQGSMPDRYKDFSLLDFYREFDWGFHAHIYNWLDIEYTNNVEKFIEQDDKEQRIYLRTPKGELVHKNRLALDGSWCPCEHFVKTLKDLEIIQLVVESEKYTPRYDLVAGVLEGLGQQGQADICINRSPFGKLVHEYMGFEKVVYALMDAPQVITDFMKVQKSRDIEVIRLAAESPARLVIISDHADENLIAPNHYEQYCIPFYQKATKILHKANKFVSTHLDGNFKGFFPILHKTGFDILDGCTPAPMFNYQVEELAEIMPEGMYAFCGVPASLFCQGLPTEEILAFGDRITKALKGRAILNVGDILPPNGDIEQVIALGKFVKSTYK